MTTERAECTGLVLAGGQAGRTAGIDRGLQVHLGIPLALHALLRLAPQVGQVMINANSNLAAYESMGVPVWPDSMSGDAPGEGGLLAGWLTGLEQCATPYLVTVACDAPRFPMDLVERLAADRDGADAEIAMAAARADGEIQRRAEFCLIKASLLESLAEFLRAGGREFARFAGAHRCVDTIFDDASAFLRAP